MPSPSLLFPVLEVEEDLQVLDKTRLDASKTFIGEGGAVVTSLTIIPEIGVTAVDVFTPAAGDSSKYYLDWMYSGFTTNLDSTNNHIDFAEGGGAPVVAIVPAAAYTLAQLATAIKAAMEAVSPGSLTYTVSYDVLDQITISTTGVFSLFPETGKYRDVQLLKDIGFFYEQFTTGLASMTGKRTDHVIKIATATVGDGTSTALVKKYIRVFSVAGDKLYSTDSQIKENEPDILRYVSDGRSSFLTQHRLAQKDMFRWLDRKGYVDVYNNPFTKYSIPRIEELKDWSKFLTLRLIYQGLIVSTDDIFDRKSRSYKGMEVDARDRAVLRLDVDGDGKVDTFENIGIQFASVVRR